MQTKPTPTEGQNSTKLEAESALRGAACSSSFDSLSLIKWRQWAFEICADFKIKYDPHDEGLRMAITKRLAEMQSELCQCRAMLNDQEMTEEECIRIIEPVVGYDRRLPYVLRLPRSIMRLVGLATKYQTRN